MSLATTSTSAAVANVPRRGFTLAESLVASVVLAVAVVAIAGTLTASYQSINAGAGTSEAVAMARQLIEEISAKPFAVPATETDNSGCSGGNNDRRSYDTIDDYHGFADTSAAIETLDGDTLSVGRAGAGTFTRSVAITPGVRPTGHTAPAADFALITVTVTKPNGEAVKVSQVVTRSVITP